MRTTKTVGSSTTSYLLEGDSVVKETNNSVATNVLQSLFTDQSLSRGGKWLVPDKLGSTALLLNGDSTLAQGHSYKPFGELAAPVSDNNPLQFTGWENDGTGLMYNRARYYVPEWGRFLSEDPIRFAGGINQYVYCCNDPVNCRDSSGMAHDPAPGMGADVRRIVFNGFIPIKQTGFGFNGDGRDFSSTSNLYRFKHDVYLYPDGGWITVIRNGETVDGSGNRATAPTTDQTTTVIDNGDGTTTVEIVGSGDNPLFPSPSVDYRFTLIVSPTGVVVSGDDDAYPAYEIWSYGPGVPLSSMDGIHAPLAHLRRACLPR